jgi:hypothetical protein
MATNNMLPLAGRDILQMLVRRPASNGGEGCWGLKSVKKVMRGMRGMRV